MLVNLELLDSVIFWKFLNFLIFYFPIVHLQIFIDYQQGLCALPKFPWPPSEVPLVYLYDDMIIYKLVVIYTHLKQEPLH